MGRFIAGLVTKALAAVGIKGASASFPRGSSWGWPSFWPNSSKSRISYESEVGRVEDNSIVEACLGWLEDNWPEAPVYLAKPGKDGGEEKDFKHPLVRLLKRPNQWYGDRVLWGHTIADIKANDGNAYWHVIKNQLGIPVELYWMPAALVEPKWNESDRSSYITHYEYSIDGEKQKLGVDEVIHFREGRHPTNIRKGYARLKSGLREIFTDNEASESVATVLQNRGYMPISISPDFTGLKETNQRGPTQAEADALEAKIGAKTSGDNRGKLVVHTIPVKVQQLAYNLSEIASREIRRIPEERICALFKLPPGVVKMGAGLDRNTFENAKIEDKQAWENGIIPLHGLIADVLDFKLLPMFGVTDTEQQQIKFDTSQVEALKPDLKAAVETWLPVFEKNVIKRAALKQKLGEPTDASDDVYYSDVSGAPVAADQPPPDEEGEERAARNARQLRGRRSWEARGIIEPKPADEAVHLNGHS